MTKVHFRAIKTPQALAAYQSLIERYGQASFKKAEVIVALGGDGFMLETLHSIVKKTAPPYTPTFGLNFGSIGFLLNPVTEQNLIERIRRTQKISLKALQMVATDAWGRTFQALAFNEVALWRQTRQSARIRISVDGIERMAELTADGILLSTPCGSSAYNFSVYGPILPLDSGILALTSY